MGSQGRNELSVAWSTRYHLVYRKRRQQGERRVSKGPSKEQALIESRLGFQCWLSRSSPRLWTCVSAEPSSTVWEQHASELTCVLPGEAWLLSWWNSDLAKWKPKFSLLHQGPVSDCTPTTALGLFSVWCVHVLSCMCTPAEAIIGQHWMFCPLFFSLLQATELAFLVLSKEFVCPPWLASWIIAIHNKPFS